MTMENWWSYAAMENTKYSEKSLLHVTGTSLNWARICEERSQRLTTWNVARLVRL